MFKSLDTSVLDITLLVRVELGPLSTLEFVVEVENEQWMNEVNESITNIGLVHKIYGQIQKVISALIVAVNFL